MDSDTPIWGEDRASDTAGYWYHLIVGHPVPRTFLRLSVFACSDADAAARLGSPPPRPAKDLALYNQLLDLSAPFLKLVLHGTQRSLGVRSTQHSWAVRHLAPPVVDPSSAAERLRLAFRRGLRRGPGRAMERLRYLWRWSLRRITLRHRDGMRWLRSFYWGHRGGRSPAVARPAVGVAVGRLLVLYVFLCTVFLM